MKLLNAGLSLFRNLQLCPPLLRSEGGTNFPFVGVFTNNNSIEEFSRGFVFKDLEVAF